MKLDAGNIFGKTAVLCGGRSAEREVSLKGGSAVARALKELGIDARIVDSRDIAAILNLKIDGFEHIFNMLHGVGGEDGEIQGVLEFLGIPYTGSGIAACAVGMDKVLSKAVWRDAGLPVLSELTLKETDTYEEISQKLGSKNLAVKPALEGSSVGVSCVKKAEDWQEALFFADIKNKKVMAEPWIFGRELTVGILGNKVLPAVEIIASKEHEFYDYEAKYNANDTQYICPAQISEELSKKLQDIALKAFNAIGAKGWGRVDFLVDEKENPFILEINLIPGMTNHSLIPMAAKQIGLSFNDLVLEILTLSADCLEL